VVTFGIAVVLAIWSAYALSVLDLDLFWIKPLPAYKFILSIMTTAYLLRGMGGFLFLLVPQRSQSTRFIVVSSFICLGIGVVHSIELWELLTVEF
jgi:hypothetical protein